MPLLVDIRKKLGDFELRASFQADQGVTGILGASGCGKSMTLRCIAGIVRPDEGRIELDGTVFFDSEKKIDLKPQKRQVGLLFQNYALFPNMTVRQNLLTGVKAREKDREKADRLVREMIRRFSLDGLEGHRPFQLSGGQQQRTALARILLSKPRMLMLDEPFSALDGYLRWNLELELSEVLQEYGCSTLFVSHSRDEIYRICRQVCVMDRGTSGPVIPVKQLFDSPVSKAAALLSGCKNYSRACPAGGHTAFARDWGVTLAYKGEAPEGFRHMGIRSHYLRLVPSGEAEGLENVFRCSIRRIIEDVFSMVVMVSPADAPEVSAGDEHESWLRLELSKEAWEAFCRKEERQEEVLVHVDPGDVMLLR